MKRSDRSWTGKGLLHRVDDAFVIVSNRGVFRQVELYRRGKKLYAAHGTGFARLMPRGGTSVPSVTWDEVLGAKVEDKTQGLELA